MVRPMIGGYQMNRIRKMFALTEEGAKGTIRAAISTFFMFVSYMIPMTILMFFTMEVLENNIPSFTLISALIVAIAGFMYVAVFINYNTTYKEVYGEAKKLRIEIAEILKSLPLSYFSKHDLSDLAQTIMRDVADIEHALSHAVPQMIGFACFFIIISIMLLITNFKLGLCLVLPVILSFLLTLYSKNLQIKENKKYFNKTRENVEAFQNAIEMNQEIKSYGKKEETEKDLIKRIKQAEKIHIASEFKVGVFVNISILIIKFSLSAVITFGALMVLNSEISLLYYLGYVLAAARISDSIANTFMNLAEIYYIDARVKRINELKETLIQSGEDTDLKTFDIDLKDVSFAYSENNRVLDSVSFTCKQGEVTALVGPSGCGKTSLIRLMSRLYDYDSGKISIDGRDIKEISTESLFSKVSVVFQDVVLFNTSIMENIRLGRKNASDDEVIEAAKLANCYDFICKLPDGFNTKIGENGSKLSGGERQRISIARAFLKNAPIVLLDEISASLDVENEMKIQEALNKLIRGKTTVIISHRLKSVENVDKIVVLNKGRVEAEGSHKDLLEKSKTYGLMVERSKLTETYSY